MLGCLVLSDADFDHLVTIEVMHRGLSELFLF